MMSSNKENCEMDSQPTDSDTLTLSKESQDDSLISKSEENGTQNTQETPDNIETNSRSPGNLSDQPAQSDIQNGTAESIKSAPSPEPQIARKSASEDDTEMNQNSETSSGSLKLTGKTETDNNFSKTSDSKELAEEDMEDGELSDDGAQEDTKTENSSAEGNDESQKQGGLSTTPSNTDQGNEMSAPAVPVKRSRKSTESSDDQGNAQAKEGNTSSSSSTEEESKSERKRRKKEKERRKKEKKLKRKREKQEKKRKKRQKMSDEYGSGSPNRFESSDYDMYNERWRSPSHTRPNYAGNDRYDSYSGYGEGGRDPPGPYDSPAPDPYASPPDDSSEDEFSETLYSLVGDELMDPSVSAAEKEVLFKKSKIPGLSASKLKKIMKQKQYRERQQMRQKRADYRGSRDRRDRREDMGEKTVKCRYYAEGKCQKGERCQFSHNFIPAKKMEACKFFLQGYCAKGDMCIYLHSEVPCKYYHTGQKCFNADKCKFSHEPLSDSTRPLLEKAILLEETGTFKAERPSLLGSPPKDLANQNKAKEDDSNRPKVSSFDVSDDDGDDANMDHTGHSFTQQTHIPSIFDLDLKPSADMMAKLDAGLYEELTAPLSESDDDRFESPPKRPQSFYSDTFSTPERPERSFGDGMPKPKRNRWGPDLPNQTPPPAVSNDNYNSIQRPGNYGNYNNGGGDADKIVAKKGPLLPIPSSAAGFGPQGTTSGQPPTSTLSSTELNPSTAQAAAANLSKILNALRSNAVVANSHPDPRSSAPDPRSSAPDPRSSVPDPRAADPRVVSDPRNADPRTAAGNSATVADPRVRPTGILPDPRAPNGNIGSSKVDTKAPLSLGSLISSIKKTVPEINGKYTRPIDFNLIPVYVESRASYIPAGAENNQEMLRDPRIKKRVMSMKSEGPASTLPSLPDITADLQRIQNARLNAAPIANSRLSSSSNSSHKPSGDGISYDPRRNSIEKKHSILGQGDQNSNSEINRDVVDKPRNATRTALSKVNPMTPAFNNTSAAYDDDEEEDNSLTIDVAEDDSKMAGSTRTMETAYT